MEKHRLVLRTISYMWDNANYCKNVHHPIPTRENREHHGNFQIKLLSSVFNWVSRYILFQAKVKRAGKETTLYEYPLEHLVVIRDEKVSPFVKFKTNLPIFCFLLDSLRNKRCRTWSSMINCGEIPGHIKSKEFYCQQGKGLVIT